MSILVQGVVVAVPLTDVAQAHNLTVPPAGTSPCNAAGDADGGSIATDDPLCTAYSDQ